MKQLLITAVTIFLLFSCKKDVSNEKDPVDHFKKEDVNEKAPVVHLVAEYKAISYTRAYGMHTNGGSKETADKPFGKGYGLVQLFSKEDGSPVSSAFVVMVNKDGGICGQDTVGIKPVTPDIFEVLDNKIGSCSLNTRMYIRISPVNDQKKEVKVGDQALISYDGPTVGVVDWVYYDYQTVARTK